MNMKRIIGLCLFGALLWNGAAFGAEEGLQPSIQEEGFENQEEMPSVGEEMPDSGNETPGTEGETSDAEGETPGTEGETSDAEGETPGAEGENPDTEGEKSDTGEESPETGEGAPEPGKEPSEPEEEPPAAEVPVWKSECDTTEGFVELHHVDVWPVEEYELGTMYEDTHALRRVGNYSEAWAVLELPYMKTLELMTYSFPGNTVPFTLSLSKDGKSWEVTEFAIEIQPDTEGKERWTKIIQRCDEVDGMRYLKILWPVPSASGDWWNPYLGWISATLSESKPVQMTSKVPEALTIPRYGTAVYKLEAVVEDQMGEPMETELCWQAQGALPEGLTLTEDGILTVDAACAAGAEVTVLVTAALEETTPLAEEVQFRLEPARIGDSNYDGILDDTDLEFVYTHYGKDSRDTNWEQLRLGDVDGDGKLDIADLAYLAYYGVTAEEES